ncbi:MAG: metallophosphoesterase [Clostridia bacterium]|nr:metallophosphoesterase [Clostridia bacterium]
MDKDKLKNALLFGGAAAVTAFAAVGLDHRLIVRNYNVKSDRINGKVRIALITDLHSCRYGAEQENLINAIKNQNPDIVLMSGDIFDNKRSTKYTEIFLRRIHEMFPCYMALGNHECKVGEDDHKMKMEILSRYNVRILSNEVETIEVNGTALNICGVSDPTVYTFEPEGNDEEFFRQMENVKAVADNGNFTVLMSHNPAYYEKYIENGFDLVLCGHAHGGQWIIPGVLNGVLAPGQGLFPKYAGGEYQSEKTRMIVSRGLARESTIVPRFYNRPEVVMIDIEHGDEEIG